MNYVIQHKTAAESYASSLSYAALTQLLAVLKAGAAAAFRQHHKSELYIAVQAELERRKGLPLAVVTRYERTRPAP